jgi:hypothetical protein
MGRGHKAGLSPADRFDSSTPQTKTAGGLLAAAYGKSVQAARWAGVPVAAEVADAVLDGLGERLAGEAFTPAKREAPARVRRVGASST